VSSSSGSINDFLALVRRELGADDARIVPADEADATEGEALLRHDLSNSRALVVSYATPPADLEARGRRLELLVSSFHALLEGPRERDSRTPPAQSLREELRALAERAEAIDALVIDARSPVVWGSALADCSAEGQPKSKGPQPANDLDSRPAACRRAIDAVRALPSLETLHKGGHLYHTEAFPDFAYVAHSFAAIYVLVLAYGSAPDEVRAHRAVQLALPTIERLVLALPPHDPPPNLAGVIALRRPRRR
jgi:hypothetical protein